MQTSEKGWLTVPEVAAELRIPRSRAYELIQRGELRPGDRLPPERELCQQLGVSEWNEPPPETEPAKRDASPFGHIGLGLGLDVDDAADAVAVRSSTTRPFQSSRTSVGSMGVPSVR